MKTVPKNLISAARAAMPLKHSPICWTDAELAALVRAVIEELRKTSTIAETKTRQPKP